MKKQGVGFACIILIVFLTDISYSFASPEHESAPSGAPVAEVESDKKTELPSPSLSSPNSSLTDIDNSVLAATKLKAEQGDAAAQRALGIAYYKGEGMPENYKQAVFWWQKAVKQRDPIAQWSLGLAYYEGKGVVKNYERAVYWFRKAAEQGNPEAQSNLGLAYYLGIAVPENRVLAYMWLSIAVTSGVHDSIGVAKFRDELEATMTSTQVASAQEMASRWKTGDADPGRRFALTHKHRSDKSEKRVLSKSDTHVKDQSTPARFKPTQLDKAADSIIDGSKKAWKSIVDYFSKFKTEMTYKNARVS